MEEKTVGSADNFLIIQFQSLHSHIDSIITNTTSRINTFILICTIAVSIFLFGRNSNLYIILLTSGALLYIGLYFVDRLVHAKLKIIEYFRIINKIRKYFDEKDNRVGKICSPLPLEANKPEKMKQIFDPGIWIIFVINSFIIGSFTFYIPRLNLTYKSICFVLFFALSLSLHLLHSKLKENNYFAGV